MLFRLVRPMRRTGSRNRYYVRRIPVDVRRKVVCLTLAIPVGEQTKAEPVALTHRESTALAGVLYRSWDGGEGRERTIAIEHTLGVGWQRIDSIHPEPEEWEAVFTHLEMIAASGERSRHIPAMLARTFG